MARMSMVFLLLAAAGCSNSTASNYTADTAEQGPAACCAMEAPPCCSPGGSAEAAVSAVVVGRTFEGTYPIHAVCTTGMVAELVRAVGGPRVKITQLMGEGVDPHLYKPTPGDVSAMNAADIIFYSGLHLEGKMADLFVRMASRKPTFPVTEYIGEQFILETPEGAYDPHVWFDVSLWRRALDVVRDVLVQYDPSHAEQYAQRAAEYGKQLNELHEYAASKLAEVPVEQRTLITAHDAFGYFGRAYDVDVRGIQGISTDSEAGVKEINALVDLLVKRKIKAVFIETSVSDRNVKALVEGARARGHNVVIGGELFSDAMGKAGTPEGTYLGMVRHNVDTIANALK